MFRFPINVKRKQNNGYRERSVTEISALIKTANESWNDNIFIILSDHSGMQ